MTRATFTNTTGFRVRWDDCVLEEETKWIDGKGEVTKYEWLAAKSVEDGTAYDSEREAKAAWNESGHGFPFGHPKCQATIEKVEFKPNISEIPVINAVPNASHSIASGVICASSARTS